MCNPGLFHKRKNGLPLLNIYVYPKSPEGPLIGYNYCREQVDMFFFSWTEIQGKHIGSILIVRRVFSLMHGSIFNGNGVVVDWFTSSQKNRDKLVDINIVKLLWLGRLIPNGKLIFLSFQEAICCRPTAEIWKRSQIFYNVLGIILNQDNFVCTYIYKCNKNPKKYFKNGSEFK